ncbi:MAG: glycosyltransferase family 4 protein [Planctomycetes bacterium]|nr:glycosyltransferase family 4 protein [Planctomycetota bacterium]
MRVAYVCADPGVPVFGCKGCSIHVQAVLRALLKQRIDVELFASRIGGNAPDGLHSLPVNCLPRARDAEPAAREQQLFGVNLTLRKTLEQKGPFDLVYERYTLWSCAAMEYARDGGFPGLLEVNAPLVQEQAKYRRLFHAGLAEEVARRVFGAAAILLAVSEEVADFLNQYPDAHQRVHVIPNGVDPDRFALSRDDRQHKKETFTVGFVGTLKPWHGLDILLEAFSRLYQRDPSIRLLIVGDGPQRPDLEAKIASWSPALRQAVRLTGAVAGDVVPKLLAEMDVAAAPYPALADFYFSPLKVYEYMAAGRAVVASRIGQLARLIEDGRNGVLCSPGNVSELTDAIWRLRRDPAKRDRLGRSARELVSREYAWDVLVGRSLGLARAHSLHNGNP